MGVCGWERGRELQLTVRHGRASGCQASEGILGPSGELEVTFGKAVRAGGMDRMTKQ